MTKDSGCLEGPRDAPAIRWFQLPARLIIAFPFVHTPETSLIRPPSLAKQTPTKEPQDFLDALDEEPEREMGRKLVGAPPLGVCLCPHLSWKSLAAPAVYGTENS